MNKEIDGITTTQARSICALILHKDVSKLTEVQMRTFARAHLRIVKQTPAEAITKAAQPYKKNYK